MVNVFQNRPVITNLNWGAENIRSLQDLRKLHIRQLCAHLLPAVDTPVIRVCVNTTKSEAHQPLCISAIQNEASLF